MKVKRLILNSFYDSLEHGFENDVVGIDSRSADYRKDMQKYCYISA